MVGRVLRPLSKYCGQGFVAFNFAHSTGLFFLALVICILHCNLHRIMKNQSAGDKN